MSFNTQPPEGGWNLEREYLKGGGSFNTQPPEGGWGFPLWVLIKINQGFQHTAARRRLVADTNLLDTASTVSTHSRPKAAGALFPFFLTRVAHSFNTQPPEGGWQAI